MSALTPSTIVTLVSGGVVAAIFILLTTFVPSRYKPAADPKDDHIQILVLGDIGRSPRMQYHALSVLKHGLKVDLVGYKESARHPDLIGNPNVKVYPLSQTPEVFDWGTTWFFIAKPLKALWQMFIVFYGIAYAEPAPRWIIIQNPPSIPTLHVALLVSLLRGSRLLVDWHNYGWSIMQMQRSPKNPLVYLYKRYETFFGRHTPTANLTVTDAMAKQLASPPFSVKTPIYTLHDRPAAVFQPIASAADRKAFLSKLAETKNRAESIIAGTTKLLLSSTSWTPDEDFALLLDALVAYAARASEKGVAPTPILAIITGKGPNKTQCEEWISQLVAAGKLPGVQIVTAWLSTRDYATLLSCADLGVCLHKSSSGVDLPMKVVDMFGAGLPVAAYSAYESFGELVKEGENGCGFETAPELAAILIRLFADKGKAELAMLKKGAIKEGSSRWDAEWDRVVAPVVGVTGVGNARRIL